MRAKWQKIETGWYTLGPAAGICREQDGRWHVYISKGEYPGDCDFATLRDAQKHVADTLPAEPLSPATWAVESTVWNGSSWEWVRLSTHRSREAALRASERAQRRATMTGIAVRVTEAV